MLKIDKNHPKQEQVDKLMEAIDQVRLDAEGGYPSQWVIANDTLIIATVACGVDNEPELKITPVDQFITETLEDFEEYPDLWDDVLRYFKKSRRRLRSGKERTIPLKDVK